MTTTNVDNGAVAWRDCVHEDALLAFADEDTFLAGTLFGRKTTSADSYAGVITGTGTRVPTISARAGKSLKPGVYTMVAGTLTSGVGTWTLTDPDGQVQTDTTSAAGEDMQFAALGVDVAIADTGTNFVTADSIAFTVAAPSSNVYAPYSATGVNGAQTPSAVLPYEAYKATAGNLSGRLIVGGQVVKERLIIDGVGAATAAALESLRSFSIVPVAVNQLNALDNQPA